MQVTGTLQQCEWPECPGRYDPILVHDDGDWHDQCRTDWIRSEVRAHRGQTGRVPELASAVVDRYIDDLLARADASRDG